MLDFTIIDAELQKTPTWLFKSDTLPQILTRLPLNLVGVCFVTYENLLLQAAG